MPSSWRAAVAGMDAATAACAALNLTYFVHRLTSRGDQLSRRLAAGALSLVSLGALVESLFFLALPAISAPNPGLASLPWTLARALPLTGAAFISVLVIRRISSS